MSWESVGSVDTGQMPEDESWILFCYGLVKRYLLHVCGEPPDDCKLGIMWHEHELGSYPSLGLFREYSTWDSDNYLYKCESVMERFNEAVDWNAIKPDHDDDVDDDEDEYEDQDES